MNLDALLHVFYLDVYEFKVYDLFNRPQTRILRGIAVVVMVIHFVGRPDNMTINLPRKKVVVVS